MLKFELRNIKSAVSKNCHPHGLPVLLGIADVFPFPPYDGEHPAYELELDGVEHRAGVFSLRGLALVVARHLVIVSYRRKRRLGYRGLDGCHGQFRDLGPSPDGGSRGVGERRDPDVTGVLPGIVEGLEIVGGGDGGDGVDGSYALYACQQRVARQDLRVLADGLLHLLLDPVYESSDDGGQLPRPLDLPAHLPGGP